MAETGTMDVASFREAIGHFTTGVAVVTSVGENGPSGLTASALTSLSIDPLMVLVCFDRTSRTLAALQHSGRICLNILGREQREVALHFAGKAPEAEQFSGVAWRDVDGLPVLEGVITWIAGELVELLPGGDHLIAVVRVTRVDVPGGEPLVYHRGMFFELNEGA